MTRMAEGMLAQHGPRFAVTPGPRGLAMLPSALAMKRDPLGFALAAMRQYGEVTRIPAPGRTIFLLAGADAARHVLCDHHANYHKGIGLDEVRGLLGNGVLTGDGAAWMHSRRRVQPLFDCELRGAFEAAVVTAAQTAARRWSEASRDAAIDIVEEMDRLTLNVAGRVFLQADLDPVAPFVSQQFATLSSHAMARATALCSALQWLPTIGSIRASRARRSLRRVVASTGSGADAPSPEERATLLLAGYDTSAATLSWTWHLLARHPEVRARVECELATLPESGATTLDALPYLRQVVEEVLRLYPAVWLLPRRSQARDCISGHDVPAGADVLVCVAALHRNPAYWRDPDRFDPSRFDPQAGTRRHSYAYLPFGAGPRTCIGSQFGIAEVVLAVSVLARQFRLNPTSEAMPDAVAGLTLRPGRRRQLRLQPRRMSNLGSQEDRS